MAWRSWQRLVSDLVLAHPAHLSYPLKALNRAKRPNQEVFGAFPYDRSEKVPSSLWRRVVSNQCLLHSTPVITHFAPAIAMV